MTAYTANVVFSVGILVSSFVFNTAIMMKPFVGEPVPLIGLLQGAACRSFLGHCGRLHLGRGHA